MDETLIPKIIVYGTPILAIVIAIIVYIVKHQKGCAEKIKRDEAARQEKIKSEKLFFESQGCTLSKKIGDLLIDNEHKKWMVTTEKKIHDYSEIIAVNIVVNGNKMNSNMISKSVYQTINSLSVTITTTDILNPIVEITVMPFSNIGYDTTSYIFSELQKIALQQEATLNAIINESHQKQE